MPQWDELSQAEATALNGRSAPVASMKLSRVLQEAQSFYHSGLPSATDIYEISAYLKIRQVDHARAFVGRCLVETPEAPDLLLKQASILALDAKYDEAAEQLMALNRRLPGKPAILRRLVAVFEQMRDTGKAAAFLRAYQKAVPDDPWASSKAEQFRALGLV